MSSRYNFDIQQYSVLDLERLFQLRSNTYTVDDIQFKRKEFYEKIRTSTGDPGLLKELNTFLDRARDLMVYFLKPSSKEVEDLRPRKKDPPEEGGELSLDYYHHTRSLSTKNPYEIPPQSVDRSRIELLEPNLGEFKTVMQNEFNPGKINPLHTPVLSKCLNIDTRFRDNLYSTQSSNFMLTLPTKIRKVVSMQLSAYEMPVTFYSTSASYGNNYLNVICTYNTVVNNDMNDPSGNGIATVTYTVIVPDGNYSANDLLSYINHALRPINTIDGSLKYTSFSTHAYTIFNCVQLSIDLNANGSGSGKVSIVVSDPDMFAYAYTVQSVALDFTLNIHQLPDTVSITTKMGWNLGFIRPKYSGKTTYVSDTLPDPASVRYLYLVINDFNNSVNNHFVGAFNNWILNDNILARIPVNGQYFNILMENELSQHLEPRRYFGPVDIQRLHIQLLDDHGRIVDVNYANFSICLTFKCLYD